MIEIQNTTERKTAANLGLAQAGQCGGQRSEKIGKQT